MPIPERLKIVGRWTKRITKIVIYSVGVIAIVAGVFGFVAIFNPPPENPKVQAIKHEFRMQAMELDRRTQICNSMVDSMVPGTSYMNAAASHCALMWMQMKRFQMFVGTMHISDPEIQPLLENSFRAAARYAEYQKAMNRPQFHSSDPDE